MLELKILYFTLSESVGIILLNVYGFYQTLSIYVYESSHNLLNVTPSLITKSKAHELSF